MTRYLILGVTFAFAAAVQPGPLQTYLVSQTLRNGWRRTAPAALSPLLSDGPIIALVLFVLSRVPGWWERALQCAGGVFLLYLAVSAFRAWREADAKRAAEPHSGRRSLLGATIVNLLNPGPYLGWSLVMGPLLLKGWREAPANGIALLVGFYATMVVCLFGTIVLFAAARNLGPRVRRVLIGVSAIALAAFGCYELGLGTGIVSW
jgi:threonine/homoserine/homoserine lactone efflux protein